MSNRIWYTVTVVAGGVIASAGALINPLPASESPANDGCTTARGNDLPGDEFFGLANLHALHLELSAKEWQRMQPPNSGQPFFGFGRKPGEPGQAADKPVEDSVQRHHGGSFAIEFPWTHAELTAAGTTVANVGLRYKGGGSYMPSMGKLKRNLKVDLDHYDKDQRLLSMKALNFNAGAADPTRLRESLGFAVYRDAGVPAPRTAFAEVTLTVPDKYDRELLGLFTVVEQVDRLFLKEHFKSDKGLLMKPERRPGMQQGVFEYVGDDWEQHKSRMGPRDEPSKKQAQRVIAFAKLISRADDEPFQKEVGSYLDVDEFLRFLAVTALLSNMDSVFTVGHNVYIYLNPDTNKFVFIPWDLDLSFGGFFLFGSPEQQADMSLTHPYAGENKLVDRLLAVPEFNAQYQKLLKEMAATCFAKEKLLANLDTIERATKQPLAREKAASDARNEQPGGFGFAPGFGGKSDLRGFVEKRTESIAAQIAGTSTGTVPKFGFGPGPRRDNSSKAKAEPPTTEHSGRDLSSSRKEQP